MANIAVLFIGIGDVSGGGGAERFFADFFTDYKNDPAAKHKLFMLTDNISVKQFNKISKVTDDKNLLLFKTWNNRFKARLEFFEISRLIKKNRIEALLIPLYNIHYYPLLKKIDRMNSSARPKIVPVMVDYNISYYYFDEHEKIYNFRKTFESFFQNIRIDAFISWYQSFKDFCKANAIIKSKPEVYTVTSRYSSPIAKGSFKEKQNVIVFAGRLTQTKRPLMFLQAVDRIKNEVGDWKFFVYGKGPLENEVRKYIDEKQLGSVVTLASHHNPKEIFLKTKCFVSTQDFENFPSLSMNEAMATGNAIISRNVGQTALFVKDNINGYLLKEDSVKGLAAKMLEYINSTDSIKEKMGEESYRLTQTVHTYRNFKSQMENIWDTVLNGK